MAVDGVIKAGTESKWGISQESTFGTVIADAGTFEQFEGPIPTGIDLGMIKDIEPKFDGSRVRKDSNVFYSESGGIRVISFSDLIVRRIDLGSLLYAVCQNVSEGDVSPFTKTFTITDSTTQPNFATNGGYFCTLAIDDAVANVDRIWKSCILKTLTLTADLSGDGRLKASGEWISGFDTDSAGALSGTWAYNAQNYYNFNEMSAKQINNTDMVVYGWDVTINNNAVRVGSDSGGDAESYGLGFYDITGNLSVKWDTNTAGYFANARVGTGAELDLQVGTGGAAGHFGILLDEMVFSDPDKDYGDPRGQIINVPFTAVHNTSANLATFTVSDGLNQTW